MITSEKSHQYWVAGVATTLVVLVALVSGAVGNGIRASMTPVHETATTTSSMAGSLLIEKDSAEPAGPTTDPCDPSYIYYTEECLDQYEGDSTVGSYANSSQMALPVLDPLEIPILQKDGETVHCQRGTISMPALADGWVLINTNRIELSTDGGGDLTLSPSGSIEPERIAIVVNSTRAAWLPATAAGSRITMAINAWVPDTTMWWHLRICAITG